jgi:hypothetical protein
MKPRWTLAAVLGIGVLAVPLTRLLPLHPASQDGRIHEGSFTKLEGALGRHLWAPTWLPEGMVPVDGGSLQGVHRVLTNYENPSTQVALIVAQEPRTPDRDRYHRERILPRADIKASIGEQRGYFMRDVTGQRRLFWHTDDCWIAVSSYHMTDDELLRVAQSLQRGADPGDRETALAARAPGGAAATPAPGDPKKE